MARIPVVSESDEVIGYKEREALIAGDIYRVSGVWITDPAGRVLLARRALTKDNEPGKWGPAVAGTVEEGESYEANALKETREEIGLILAPNDLVPLHKTLRRTKTRTYFAQWYGYQYSGSLDSLELDAREVDSVRWVDPPELAREIREHPETFVPTATQWEGVLLRM